MELDQVLGEVLRAERKERGLSQEALALDAGIERNYISLIELGRNSPSVRMLYKICSALGLTPAAFLARVDEQMRGRPKRKATKK